MSAMQHAQKITPGIHVPLQGQPWQKNLSSGLQDAIPHLFRDMRLLLFWDTKAIRMLSS